jgi:hypothetical protein
MMRMLSQFWLCLYGLCSLLFATPGVVAQTAPGWPITDPAGCGFF